MARSGDTLFVLFKDGEMLLGTKGPKWKPRRHPYVYRSLPAAKAQKNEQGADEIRAFVDAGPVEM